MTPPVQTAKKIFPQNLAIKKRGEPFPFSFHFPSEKNFAKFFDPPGFFPLQFLNFKKIWGLEHFMAPKLRRRAFDKSKPL